MSRPNVADWQYLGVDKITRRLEWNSGRKARKGHICEDSLAYGSYSSKDVTCEGGIVVLELEEEERLFGKINVHLIRIIIHDWLCLGDCH